MDKILNTLKEKFEKNRSQILFCLISTFIVGMITHGYMFLQDAVSHDSLNEFYGYNDWKVQLGRFITPLYKTLTRGNMTLPWLIGLYSLLWLGLTVFFTVKIFNVKSKIFTVMIAGIYVANIAVISTTATYIHDLDCYMFSLLLAVIAIYLWNRYPEGSLFAIPVVAVSMGLYQSYLSVMLTLIVFVLVLNLLSGARFKQIFYKGLKSVGMLFAGGVLYFVTFKTVLAITGLTELTDTYNSVGNMFGMSMADRVETFREAYTVAFDRMFCPVSTLGIFVTVLTAALVIAAIVLIVRKMIRKQMGISEIALTVALIAVLPLFMNVTRFLSGYSHDLMHFAVWLIYLFVLLLVYHEYTEQPRRGKKASVVTAKTFCKMLSLLFVFIILSSNVVLANQAYIKKDMEEDANLSFFTRVLDRMEQVEEYDHNKTPVVFVGRPESFPKGTASNGFEAASELLWGEDPLVIGSLYPERYQKYFYYKLHCTIRVLPHEKAREYQYMDAVKEMPSFPKAGSVAMLDGVLVVKFS